MNEKVLISFNPQLLPKIDQFTTAYIYRTHFLLLVMFGVLGRNIQKLPS